MMETWMPKIKPPVALRHCPWCKRQPALVESYPFHYRVQCLNEECAVFPGTGTYDNQDEPCKKWNSMRA